MAQQRSDGLMASFVVIPTELSWASLESFLWARFPFINAELLSDKLQAGGFFYDNGETVPFNAPLVRGQRLWYFRHNPKEPQIPFEIQTLYEDEHILVIDKPHFLSTTPVGRFMRETVVTRLRNQTGNMAISPAHRLDRATAGVLLLTKQVDVREKYQRLFQERKTEKHYLAVCHRSGKPIPDQIALHLKEDPNSLCMQVIQGAPNSVTYVQTLAQNDDFVLLRLSPISGKKHQLRCHLAHVGAAIVNDRWYPSKRPDQEDDFNKPLQLLSEELAFTDPISGRAQRFQTRQTLAMQPLFPNWKPAP